MQEKLKETLSYDPSTGIFKWRISSGKVIAGAIAGGSDAKGYIKIQFCGRKFGGHQLAWLYIHGYIPSMIDHANELPWDNRLCNLREADYSQNNHRKSVRNPTGFRGVRFRSGAYEANIRINGKITKLGKYNSPEEASEAYEKAAKEYYREYAYEGSKA